MLVYHSCGRPQFGVYGEPRRLGLTYSGCDGSRCPLIPNVLASCHPGCAHLVSALPQTVAIEKPRLSRAKTGEPFEIELALPAGPRRRVISAESWRMAAVTGGPVLSASFWLPSRDAFAHLTPLDQHDGRSLGVTRSDAPAEKTAISPAHHQKWTK